jgi:ABC-type uncharacterized transport system fused permease/ATPase subunit
MHGLIRDRLPGATILAVSHRAALFGSYDRVVRIDRRQNRDNLQ